VIFPVVLLGLRWRPLIILLPSFLLYLIVQATNLSVPAYPEGHLWYFNPLAWQFLFIAGAALGFPWRQGRQWSRWVRPALPLAAVVVATGFVVKLSWTIHGIWDPFPGLLLKELWPVNKNNLSPIRVIPFFAAVAVVAVVVPPNAVILRSLAAKPLVLCGQQSLEIFCLGILLSALGHFLLSEYDSAISVQLLVNLAGILVMCLTARMLDWYKTMGRTQGPRLAAAQSGRGNRLGK
jgi:hypothetical protein